MVEKYYTIPIDFSAATSRGAMVFVKGDHNTCGFNFIVTQDITDTRPFVTFRLPDGTNYIKEGTVTGEHTASLTLDSGHLSQVGEVVCQIALYGDTERLTSAISFNFDVAADESDGAIEASDQYPILTQLITDCQYIYDARGEVNQSVTKASGYASDASQSAQDALDNILNGVSIHNQSDAAHADIRQDIRSVEAIARGRATGYVFDTFADMVAWLSIPENVSKLVMGDNLYIRAIGVKDYWWDGTTYQKLESECPDLTNYYTKEQTDALMPIRISRTAYNALVSAGTVQSDRDYDVYEG